jgi:hypothetical protein
MRPCSDRVLVSGINFLVDFEDDLATAPTTGTQKDREMGSTGTRYNFSHLLQVPVLSTGTVVLYIPSWYMCTTSL